MAGARVDTYVEHSRLLALVPIAGQFQNGDEGAGWGFLLSESALFLIAAGTGGWWVSVRDQYNQAYASGSTAFDYGGAERLALGLQIVSLVTLNSAIVLTVAGILEAQVNFVPGHTVSTHISIPPELMEPEDEEVPRDPEPSVSFGLTSLRVSF